jgi:hypothetical protein
MMIVNIMDSKSDPDGIYRPRRSTLESGKPAHMPL